MNDGKENEMFVSEFQKKKIRAQLEAAEADLHVAYGDHMFVWAPSPDEEVTVKWSMSIEFVLSCVRQSGKHPNAVARYLRAKKEADRIDGVPLTNGELIDDDAWADWPRLPQGYVAVSTAWEKRPEYLIFRGADGKFNTTLGHTGLSPDDLGSITLVGDFPFRVIALHTDPVKKEESDEE